MDAVGRKASLLAFSVMSLFIGWTLLMAASQIWQLYAGRFLLGLGAGLEITISPVYIHEICRPIMQDVCGSFPQIFIAVGILICYIMGRSLEWNWLALASCVFLFPFTFGLYFIPESPPWLVYNGEEDLAFKSMVLIRGEEYDATVEIRKIKDNLARHQNDLHALLQENECNNRDSSVPGGGGGTGGSNNNNDAAPPLQKFRFKDLWQVSVLYPFLVILVLMFLFQFSGQGAITFYTALIFKEAECIVDHNDCALIIGVTYFLSSILGLFLKKHIGRRVLLLVSEFGMGMAQLAMGAYLYFLSENSDMLKETPEDTDSLSPPETPLRPFWNTELIRWLPIPILIVFTVAFNIGMGSLTWVVATEVLPVRSKRYTHTISNMTSNFWWFVVTKTFKDMHMNWGSYWPFFLYGSVCVFGFVFILIFLPETKDKKPEVTAEFFSRPPPALRKIFQCRDLCKAIRRCWPLRRLNQNGSNATTAAASGNNNLSASTAAACEAAATAADSCNYQDSLAAGHTDLELSATRETAASTATLPMSAAITNSRNSLKSKNGDDKRASIES